MSCKSALYTANTGAQTVAVGGTINLGSIVRRFGKCVTLNGTGITIMEPGYYDVDVSVTAAPTAAGTVIVTMYKDGVAVPGATASATAAAAGDPVNLSISALIRHCCACSGTTLTLVLTGAAASVTNVAATVERI